MTLYSAGSKWSWDNGNCLKTPPSKEPYFSGKEIYFGVLLGNTVTVQNLKERRRRGRRKKREAGAGAGGPIDDEAQFHHS